MQVRLPKLKLGYLSRTWSHIYLSLLRLLKLPLEAGNKMASFFLQFSSSACLPLAKSNRKSRELGKYSFAGSLSLRYKKGREEQRRSRETTPPPEHISLSLLSNNLLIFLKLSITMMQWREEWVTLSEGARCNIATAPERRERKLGRRVWEEGKRKRHMNGKGSDKSFVKCMLNRAQTLWVGVKWRLTEKSS